MVIKTMSRFRADMLLLLTAILWGGAFVVQKTAMADLGPFGFVGSRFLLSLVVVLPFVLREAKTQPALTRADLLPIAILCSVFFLGVILQQTGIVTTSVTHAGILTGLYILLVPLFAWPLFRRAPSWYIAPASMLAFAGIWLLSGGTLTTLNSGDALVIVCALCFGLQVALMGWLAQKTQRPITISALQYGLCAGFGLAVGMYGEGLTLSAMYNNMGQILYAGIVAGGIGFTLQAVAQKYTPPADAGIILSCEFLFAALAGAIFLGERLDTLGWLGGLLILLAIVIVELGPRLLPNILPRLKFRL